MSKLASLKKPMFTGSVISKSEAAIAFAEAHSEKVDADLPVSPVITKGQTAPAGHKRLTINIETDLHRQLRMAALANSTTATAIIETLVKEHLKSHKR
jgi:hypothetical protein